MLRAVSLIAAPLAGFLGFVFFVGTRPAQGTRLGDGVTDVSMGDASRGEEQFCFPPEEREDLSLFFAPKRQLRLEIAGWQSHKVVTRMAEILLREKIGYNVTVLNFGGRWNEPTTTGDPRMCPADETSSVSGAPGFRARGTGECRVLRLRDNVVDINLELWPGSFLNDSVTTEVMSKAYVSASELGSIGYLGRSGWFIPRASLRDVATGPYGDAPWRALMPLLSSVQHTLANHTRLPVPPSTCDKMIHATFGSYNCSAGEWTSETANCCSRAASAAGTCAVGLPPCAVLHIEAIGSDSNRNEAALAGSGLELQIQYGPLQERIEQSQREALPLLFYNWEPNPKVITEDDFVRVRLTDPTDCQPYGSPYDRSRRDSYSSRMYSRACDFPTQSIIKMARTELSFRDAPAYKFATDFRLTFDQISSIMTNDSLTQAANSSDDSFNRACGFLRYASPGPSCTVSDGGCWTSWVSEARDELPQSWRKLPFAPIFAQPSLGIYVSEQLIMYITMLFIVTAIYVFLRGDDGYSSGRAGMTLPHLMRFLIGCPVRIFKFTRSTKVLTASSKGGDETKPTAVTRAHMVRQGTAQWLDMGQMAENSITLGRAQIIIAATDRYVAVPILRLDKSDCTSSVLLRTRDGLHGNAAQFGRDYGPIRATASDVGAPSGADHQLRLDFAPKSRLRFVYVDILKRTKRVTGEHDWAVFTIHMSNVSDAGGGAPAIGPVSSCAVRIIKPGKFPSLPESIGLGEIGTMKNNAKPAVTRLGSNMTRLGLVNHVGLGKARGLGLSTLKHGSDVFLRLSLVHAFITESFRIGGLKKKVVWHQIAYFLLAIESSFLYPLMYSYIISFGVQARRQDMAVWIALWMLTLLLGKYRIKLNYFHGSMLVLQHLRAMLARKFLSLREYDHMVHPKIAQDFRVAIQSTCEEIRNQTWKGVFHNGLPNLYKVVWSVAYLLAFQWKDSTILIVSILFAIVCAIYGLRARSGAVVAKQEFRISQKTEDELEYLIQHWRLVHETGKEQAVTKRVFDGFWEYIRSGLYVTWYHRFYTAWSFTFVRLFVMYGVVWLYLAPQTTTADFVALNTALGSLGSALQAVGEDLLDVLVSTAKIDEVARLLNYKSIEDQRADKNVDIPPRAHSALAADLDALIQRWEVNAADAQATTSLIAETRALTVISDASADAASNVVSDMADLMASWASLLDHDDTDAGGTMLIYDVGYKLPHDPTPIFEGMCIDDQCDRSDSTSNDPIRLPAGVIIGLRTTSNNASFATTADQRAAKTLAQMLAGVSSPQSGIARSIAKTQMVDGSPMMAPGTLWDALVVDADCDNSGNMPTPDRVWQLCHMVGMSPSVIGSSSGELNEWQKIKFTGATIPHDDMVRVAVVRALLARPDALVLYRVGLDWSISKQAELIAVLRAFLAGALIPLTHGHIDTSSVATIQSSRSYQTRTSVVFCSSDMSLAHLLSDSDVVLSLDSRSGGTLRKKSEAFPDVKAVVEAYMGLGKPPELKVKPAAVEQEKPRAVVEEDDFVETEDL